MDRNNMNICSEVLISRRTSVRTPPRTLLWVCSVVLLCATGCHSMMSGGNNAQGVRDFQNGNLDSAERRFRTAVQMNPQSPDASYNLAATVHRRGVKSQDQAAIAEAEQLYNRCLNLNEEHIEAHRELAVLLAQTGRSDSSFRLLKNWATRSPESADARIELARLYEEFGDADLAESRLQEALQREPNNTKARQALAYLQERSGDARSAVSNYEHVYRSTRDPKLAARIARLGNSSGGANLAVGPKNLPTTQTAADNWSRRY
jgi:tetratricopeptide (TPR) repeat protein